MITLRSYVGGRWIEGGGAPQTLRQPGDRGAARQPRRAKASTSPRRSITPARSGGPALRALTFAERGAMLRPMAKAIHAHRDELIDLAVANGGNTRGDAKFDIDGAVGTLSAYAELGPALGDRAVPRRRRGHPARPLAAAFTASTSACRAHGVAVHINAFNFPAWGFAEKAACALLAGMPVVTKPATSTALRRAPDHGDPGRRPRSCRTARCRSSWAAPAICSSTSARRTCSRSPARATPARASARCPT